MKNSISTCRCGHDGKGSHPCHGRGHTCKKPATQRFYGPKAVSLAGNQLKFNVQMTWSCDDCWHDFEAMRSKR